MYLSDADKSEFLAIFPEMRIVPSRDRSRVYEGQFRFVGESKEWGQVEDVYHLRIVVDPNPRSLPQVWDMAGRVAQINSSHVNLAADGTRTGTLCLGSYLRLRMEAGQPLTLVGFAKRCIVPYLYAMTLREQGRPAFVFGELAHGSAGLLQDYEQILGVTGLSRVVSALHLAARRRRVANKSSCPCGCGRRLGKCEIHHRLNALRRLAPRSYLGKLTDGSQLTPPTGGL